MGSLRARAMNRASSYFTKGADFLAPKLEGLSLKLDERREKKEWPTDAQTITTPKGGLRTPATTSPSSRTGWRSYFGGSSTGENENPYTEENIRCVPGVSPAYSQSVGSLIEISIIVCVTQIRLARYSLPGVHLPFTTPQQRQSIPTSILQPRNSFRSSPPHSSPSPFRFDHCDRRGRR